MQSCQDAGHLLALQEVLHSLGRKHDLVGNAFRVNLLELTQNDGGGVNQTLNLGRAGGDYGIFGREANLGRQGALLGVGRSSPMNFTPVMPAARNWAMVVLGKSPRMLIFMTTPMRRLSGATRISSTRPTSTPRNLTPESTWRPCTDSSK